jgi:hypothetical protein
MNRFGVGEPVTFELAYERISYAMDRFVYAQSGSEKRTWIQLMDTSLGQVIATFEERYDIEAFDRMMPLDEATFAVSGLKLRAPYVVREHVHPTNRSLNCHEVDEREQQIPLLYQGIDWQFFTVNPDDEEGNFRYVGDAYLLGYDLNALMESPDYATRVYVPLGGLVFMDRVEAQ